MKDSELIRHLRFCEKAIQHLDRLYEAQREGDSDAGVLWRRHQPEAETYRHDAAQIRQVLAGKGVTPPPQGGTPAPVPLPSAEIIDFSRWRQVKAG